jgi:hypothetical protein
MKLPVALATVVVAASCFPSLTVPPGARLACRGDDDCPAGLVCDGGRDLCIPRDGPCVDGGAAVVDGAPCTDANGDDGICNAGACAPSACGDGVVDPAREECDLGAANADDVPGVCRTDCTLPRCGDGVVDVNEGCDEAGNEHCVECQLVCPVGRSDCDGVGPCECAAPPLDVAINRVFAMVADASAVYLAATGDAWDAFRILRVPFDGGDVTTVADVADVFGDLTLTNDRIAWRENGALRDAPKTGGAARTLLDAFFLDAAADGDDIVVVDDDNDCVRIHPNGDAEVFSPPIPAVTSVAVVRGDVFVSTDNGVVARVTPDGLDVLAENQFEVAGVTLASDGRALWWLDERGALNRLDPDGSGVVVAAVAPAPLVGARPYELQIDDFGYAWRAELATGSFDDVVVEGVPPGGPRMRARPNDPVDAVAISATKICFASFDLVSCLPR